MFKSILFDLDGTICDTNQLILQSLRHVLLSENFSNVSDNLLLTYWGKPLYYQLNKFLPGRNDYDSLVERYRIFYSDNQNDYLTEFDGIVEMLNELKLTNKTVGIVTSKHTRFAKETLDHLNYSQYFKFIIGCDLVRNVKPDPEPILKAIEITGYEKSETIYIGDNVDDIIAAHNSNISSAVVGWSLTNREILLNALPNYIFETPLDVLKQVL
jgi:pyrophosphatase PpaX